MGLEDRSDVERLASVETELRGLKELVIKIDGKFDAWSQNFPSRNEVKEMFVARDQKLDRLEQDRQNNKNSWPAWVAVAIAAATLLYSVWPH